MSVNKPVVPWHVELRQHASWSNALMFLMVIIPMQWALWTSMRPAFTADTFAPAPYPVLASPVDDALSGVLEARSRAALRTQLAAFQNAGLEPVGTGPVLRRAGHDLARFGAQFETIGALVTADFAQGREDAAVKLLDAAHRLARIVARGVPGDRFLAYRYAATRVQGTLDRIVFDAGRQGRLTPAAIPTLTAVYTEAVARETGVRPAVLAQLESMKSMIRRYDATVIWMRWLPCWPDAAAAVERGLAQCRAGLPVPRPDIDHPVIKARWDDFGAVTQWHAQLLRKRHRLLALLNEASETLRDERGL